MNASETITRITETIQGTMDAQPLGAFIVLITADEHPIAALPFSRALGLWPSAAQLLALATNLVGEIPDDSVVSAVALPMTDDRLADIIARVPPTASISTQPVDRD